VIAANAFEEVIERVQEELEKPNAPAVAQVILE